MNIEIRPWVLIMCLISIGVTTSKIMMHRDRAERQEIESLPSLALLGDTEAQYKLAVRYEEGEGFPKIEVKAYAYYTLAAPTNEDARKRLDALEKRLRPWLITAGKDLAAEMQREIQTNIKERDARLRIIREWEEMAERNSKK